jgi:salicylate hydroxylase
MASRPTITIIGGGISGLVLATGLLRRGIPIEIYEAAPSFGEIGLGLSLGPAAHRAMPLIDPQIREIYDNLVTTHADSPGYESFRETWFEFIWAGGVNEGSLLMDLKALPSGQTAVRRADFLKELVGLIPEGVVRFGKRLVELTEIEGDGDGQGGGGGIRLVFEDGTVEVADVVVGCDGIKSKVKEAMLPEESILAQPTYSGMYGYRAVLDMEDMVEAVGDRRARVSTLYIGKGGYGISYPIMRAKKVNVGLYVLSEEWEGESWVRPAKREDMERDARGMGRFVQALIEVCIVYFLAGRMVRYLPCLFSACLILLSGLFLNILIYLHIPGLELPFLVMRRMLRRRIKVLVRDRRLKMRMFWLSC